MKPITQKFKKTYSYHLFHDTREDVLSLADYCNMLADKINELNEELQETKRDLENAKNEV